MLVYQSKIRAIATLEGITPYSASRIHNEPMFENEDKQEYDRRTYLSHLYINDAGEVVMPSFGIHDCLVNAAQYSGKQIKGQGKKTWTKKLESGLIIFDDPSFGITPDQTIYSDINAHSSGQRGSGKRVLRRYPVILPPWRLTFPIEILDPIITEALLQEMFGIAGLLIGIGRSRPENRGKLGRFRLANMEWQADRRLAA